MSRQLTASVIMSVATFALFALSSGITMGELPQFSVPVPSPILAAF